MDDGIKQSLAEVLGSTPGALAHDTVLDGLDGWDSVTALSVMVILSEGLGHEITPEEIVRLRTFGDIENLAAAKTAGGK